MLVIQLCVFLICFRFCRKKGIDLFSFLEKADDRSFSSVLAALSVTLPFLFIQNGHNWGGDFSCYIAQAQSIVSGTMREQVEANSFMMSHSDFMHGPASYPWGFPLLLAPVIYLFGVNYIVLKCVNVLFLTLTVMAAYTLLRRKTSPAYARAGALFLATNGELLSACDCVLSDIPFLFFSLLSLCFIDKFFASKDRRLYYGIMTGAACFLAYFVRTAGIVSILTVVSVDLLLLLLRIRPLRGFRDRLPVSVQHPLSHLALYAVFFSGAILDKLIFPAGKTGYGYYFRYFSLSRLKSNIDLYINDVFGFFSHDVGNCFPLTFLLLLLFLWGAVKFAGKESVPLIYCLGMSALVFVFPAYQGVRYLYPVIVTALVLSLKAASRVGHSLPGPDWEKLFSSLRSAFAAAVAVSVALTLMKAAANNVRGKDVVYTNSSRTVYAVEAYDYISENVGEDEVIVFFKPRVLWLNTHRRSISVNAVNPTRLREADYVLLLTGEKNDALARYCARNGISVYRNREFVLYRLTDRN